MAPPRNSDSADWLQPPVAQEGLGHYVEVVRERIWVIVLAVGLTVFVAMAYLATADKVYEAEADLLITPVPSEDPLLASLGLIRESSDPTRDVETAARLATTVDVAERAASQLGLSTPPRQLLGRVAAEPVAQSNIVALTARAPTAEESAELANAFAAASVAERTEALHEQIEALLPDLRERADQQQTPALAGDPLQAQIARMETLLSGTDPTVRVETEALPPLSAVSPRPAMTLAGALLAGLVLGVGGAFALQTLDPRLRREEQLRSRYRLPILARIPKETTRGREHPLAPGSVTAATTEAYRTLRAGVIAAQRKAGGAGSVLITGSSPSEGKTTTAINLAVSLAAAGKRTILIEADLRRPAIGEALGVRPEQGIVSVLLDNTALEDALVTTTEHGPHLQLLLADYEGGWIAELFSLPSAQTLVDRAKQLADFVVIDSPPLTAVIDTLPFASKADDVLLVTRIGTTQLDKLHELGELLAGNDIVPLGFALLGSPRPEVGGYYLTDRAGAERPTSNGRRLLRGRGQGLLRREQVDRR